MFSLRTMLHVGAVVIAACGGVTGSPGHDDGHGSADIRRAREATAAFHDLDAAKQAGYGALVDAKGIACIDNPGVGAMGVHFVNGARAGDTTLDVTQPELLVYEPTRHGGLRLVALEYIVDQASWDKTHTSPPRLYGHEFHLTPAGNRYGIPAFYEIHAWVWKHNPRGLHDDWNPDVSCAKSTEDYSATA